MRRVRNRGGVLLCAALVGVACSPRVATVATVATPGADQWVATWEGPPQLTEPRNMPPAPGLSGQTIRQRIRATLGGGTWRFTFSNEFGNAPLAISSTFVARSLGRDTIDATSAILLRFLGETGVTIPPGTAVTSDAVAMTVAPLSDISITTSFGVVPADLTGHPGSRTTSYLVDPALRDRTQLPGSQAVEHWYVISGAEVWAPGGSASVVVLGNSIADGRGSGTDRNNRWPDNLARRLQARAATAAVGVLNAGIGGNAVLRGGLGPTAMDRLARDVLTQRGARWVIVSEGVNDIGGATGPDSSVAVARGLIAAYLEIIRRGHARGMRVYGATILPFGGSQYASADHELARRTVNEWIRTSGAFDAVIDFDDVMRDRSDPTRLRADGDSGDHLHPNERGYVLMAESIPLNLFEQR